MKLGIETPYSTFFINGTEIFFKIFLLLSEEQCKGISQFVSISFSMTEIQGDASFREQAGQLRKI